MNIAYGHGYMPSDIPGDRIAGVLSPHCAVSQNLPEYMLVKQALESPIGSESLGEMASAREKILLITSDHTRPMPRHITIPILFEEIRSHNSNADIRIMVATGFHRASTESELKEMFGPGVYGRETIVMHDSRDKDNMVYKGILPSGGELWLNGLIDWADLVIAEGFIEPHLFAGFSGGRKSILPGIAYEKTVMYNHNAAFIAHPNAHTGQIEGNPLHEDMLFAAQAANLAFILNVVLDSNKKIIAAFAGDSVEAHKKGCRYVRDMVRVHAKKADIVVASNGGYPLDQNIYQVVKGMTAAEACVNPGGVIIMIASCMDGHGGEGFYRWFRDAEDPQEVADRISRIPASETTPDQWEAQILARILCRCRAMILVSRDIDPQIISEMHMRHASDFDEALAMADSLLGGRPQITVIPDGVGVIVEE
jgi:nickel-dependent lactate racemase